MEEIQERQNAEIEQRFAENPSLRVSWALGQDERLNPNADVFEFYVEGAAKRVDERIPLRDLFFLPKKEGNWIENWVNFSTPEEIENQFAFYLGANYINNDEYLLLLDALKLSRQIHGSDKRSDGIRRSLNGHILPGMRYIFDNRKEVVDAILGEEGDGGLSFFESLFVYMGHDWKEDVKDEFLEKSIEKFPEHLVAKIDNLTHFEARGVSKEEYAEGINNAGKVEKFVKMVDRMMNVIDDIRKAPTLEDMNSLGTGSKVDRYLKETRDLYLGMFREADLPLFDKFESVITYVEEDSKLSKEFLRYVRNEVIKFLGLDKELISIKYFHADKDIAEDVEGSRRDRSPREKLEHIELMIRDLEQNASRYGVVPSVGMVGAIYFHDLIKNSSFIDKMRSKLNELDQGEKKNPQLANLLRYSLGIAKASRVVEDKSLIGTHLIENLYKHEKKPIRNLLHDIFSKPPKISTVKNVNKRQEAYQKFEKHKRHLYGIIPTPDKINFNTFRKSLENDIEGLLLRFLEVKINIENPPSFDPTYAWRNCQEVMYLLLPLMESFGLKGASKELTSVIQLHINGFLQEEESVEGVLKQRDSIINREEFSILESTINRVAGDEAVIEHDSKGIGATLLKSVEEGRSITTDMKRCRVILPPTQEDSDLMIKAIEIIKDVVSQTTAQNVQIFINRPYESVGGKKPKLPIRISLDNGEEMQELARSLAGNLKRDLEIPEIENLYEFVPRATGYKDVKVVFQIVPDDGSDPIYYEMIVTDSLRHANNTFGGAARIFKFIASRIEEWEGRLSKPERVLLSRLRDRTLAYSMYSNSGTNLSRATLEWLREKQLDPRDKTEDIDTVIHRDDTEAINALKGVLMHRLEYVLP